MKFEIKNKFIQFIIWGGIFLLPIALMLLSDKYFPALTKIVEKLNSVFQALHLPGAVDFILEFIFIGIVYGAISALLMICLIKDKRLAAKIACAYLLLCGFPNLALTLLIGCGLLRGICDF